MAEKRVLVIEDNAMLALDLMQMIEGLGYEAVGPASTVEGALDEIGRRPPDAATLDLDLNGDRRAELIALRLSEAQCPFVVSTGYVARRSDLPVALRKAPFLAKPLDAGAFRHAVARLCQA